MTLGKLNQDLPKLYRDCVSPELKIAYKHLSFHEVSIQNYYLETISVDQLRKSQKLIK